MKISKVKQFTGSTLEEIEDSVNNFFYCNLCPDNLLKSNLYMHNGMYQYEIWYTECILNDVADQIDIDGLIGFCPDGIDVDLDTLQMGDLVENTPKKVDFDSKLVPSMDTMGDPFENM